MTRLLTLSLYWCAYRVGVVSGFSVTLPRQESSIARRLISCTTSAPELSATCLQASLEDDEEFSRVPRRRQRGRIYEDEDEDNEFFDRVERDIYGDEEDVDEDWDDDDDDFDDDEEYGLFSDVLIDNPILDSIDPDGAAERFPELARDPRFWLDMVLFIAFLNWLSANGPQDYFPDIPYYV